MDEAILRNLLTPPLNHDQQVKTLNYFEELKNSDGGWQLCVQTLSSKEIRNEEGQFFCLQVIEHFVKTRYYNSSEEHRSILSKFLVNWIAMQTSVPSNYLCNKVAQIIALIFVQDYPQRWPNFFHDLIESSNQTTPTPEARLPLLMQYLRILTAIDTEIADRDIPRTNEELQRNNLIKDAMREKVVPGLVDTWYKILNMGDKAFPIVNPLVCSCLQVIGKYVLWIDINLVANDRFVPVLVTQLSNVHLREAAAECIHDIICKGMDPILKMKLIESFASFLTNAGVWRSISQLFHCMKEEDDPDYTAKLGKILNAMGCNLIDGCTKLLKSNEKQPDVCQQMQQAIHAKVPLMLQFFAYDYDDVCSSVLDFLRDYLHFLKLTPVMSEAQNNYIQNILDILSKKLRFDEEYDFVKEGEDEAEFREFRKQLKVIFENLAQINKGLVVDHVRNIVNIAVHNWRTLRFEDVEVALLLLYYLGEAIPSGGTSFFNSDLEKSSPIQLMLLIVVNSDVHLHTHPAVVVQYFETVVRYEKFFICHSDYICNVLGNFLRDNGLFHSDKKVRSRCAYLFCRFIKCVRSHISMQLTNDIIQAIEPLLALVTPSKNRNTDPLMSSDDQLYLYEVVGVVIISGERSNEKADLMKKVASPLLDTCRVVTEQLAIEKDPDHLEQLTDVIVQAISVIGRLSKAFSNQQTMKAYNCTSIFLDALQVFLRSIEVSTGEQQQALQSCVRQYLHRMVVCLEEELLPYIPMASEALLTNCDSKSIQEYIPLINQVICKFKKDVVPFLKQMFTPMVQCVFKSLAEPIEANDQIAIRERQMLQRQYFHFIAAIVTNNVTEVLSSNENTPILQQVMLSVIQGSVDFPDPVAQKACFSILKKFVEIWGGQQNPDGFIDFMYKNILPACFMAPCKPQFDINDAQTLLALNEIGNCLKVILDKRKEECIAYLQTYLPTLNLPPAKVQEFLQALQTSSKDFRLYLKVFFQQAKS